jgi:NAD(P)-dependent dehydrogenase (short-subunit alcohol dehydrogenase family)
VDLIGTNHLGHFVFVNLIAPLIRAGGRVVMVSSSGHRYANVDLADPNFERTPYDPWLAYGRSKTANILFAVEFDRRHKVRGVRATSLHPGGIQTELARHLDPALLPQMLEKINADLKAEGKPGFAWKSIPQGAATTVWAATVARAEDIGGRYCENCHLAEVTAAPLSDISEGVRPYALDSANAAALWAKSEEMVAERF